MHRMRNFYFATDAQYGEDRTARADPVLLVPHEQTPSQRLRLRQAQYGVGAVRNAYILLRQRAGAQPNSAMKILRSASVEP